MRDILKFKNYVYGLLLLFAVATFLLASAITKRSTMQDLRIRADATLSTYKTNLENEISRYEGMPRIFARAPMFKTLLRQPDSATLTHRVNKELEKLNTILGTLDVYILDASGQTIAASNWNKATTFIGEELSFRPYFTEAVLSGYGRYFARGTTSGKRGYYVSAVILDSDNSSATTNIPNSSIASPNPDNILGVVVVKVGISLLEAAWSGGDKRVTVTDSDGVFFISSSPDWLYRSITPLTDDKLTNIAKEQRFAEIIPKSLSGETRQPGNITKDAASSGEMLFTLKEDESAPIRNFLVSSSVIASNDWIIQIWSDLSEVDTAVKRTQWTTLLILLALALFAILTVHRIRSRLIQKQMKERAYSELEGRVEQRTYELSLSNDKLQAEIIERKQAEKDLHQAQDNLIHAGKMGVVGQMATSITHELNQPLGAVRTFADTANTFLERKDYKSVAENLGLIARMADRMSDIMRHLKSFSRKTPLSLSRVNVEQVLDETLIMLQPKINDTRINVSFEGEAKHVDVLADFVRLQQVFTNLLVNALDTLRGRDEQIISIIISVSDDPDIRLTIVVNDNGPGIDMDIVDRIFEPFLTTKTADYGMGLGLAISHSIVRDFSGSLSAENIAGGGASFRIDLIPWNEFEHGSGILQSGVSRVVTRSGTPQQHLLQQHLEGSLKHPQEPADVDAANVANMGVD